MGCDIHAYVEHRKRKLWHPSDDVWVRNSRYGESKRYRIPCHCGIYSSRNYDWFAFLAGVRNGTWGEKIPVLAEPRGLPKDCCQRIGVASRYWGLDGHSHSYLTFGELEEGYKKHKDDRIGFYGALDDRSPSPELARWLEADEYRRGSPPGGFCHSGGGGGYIYPRYRWNERLSELVGDYYGKWHDYLWDVSFEYRVANDRENVRVVFWFDN
jgi:hypothetical protein